MQKFFGLISVLSLLVWKETNSLLQSMMVSPSLTAISQSSINSSEVIGWSTHLHNPIKNPPLHIVGKSGMGQAFEDEKSAIISAFTDEKPHDADDILPNKMTDKNFVTPLTKTFNETGSSTGNAQSNKIPFFPRVIRLQQLAFMPPAISRLFNTFTFKGIGVSTSKSLVKWKSTAIGFKVPLTANFPIYDRSDVFITCADWLCCFTSVLVLPTQHCSTTQDRYIFFPAVSVRFRMVDFLVGSGHCRSSRCIHNISRKYFVLEIDNKVPLHIVDTFFARSGLGWLGDGSAPSPYVGAIPKGKSRR